MVGHKILSRYDTYYGSILFRVENYKYGITAPIYQTKVGKYAFTTEEQATEFFD